MKVLVLLILAVAAVAAPGIVRADEEIPGPPGGVPVCLELNGKVFCWVNP